MDFLPFCRLTNLAVYLALSFIYLNLILEKKYLSLWYSLLIFSDRLWPLGTMLNTIFFQVMLASLQMVFNLIFIFAPLILMGRLLKQRYCWDLLIVLED